MGRRRVSARKPAAPPHTGAVAELRPRARLAEWRWVPRAARIFVNRNLRLESMAAVGFDLDHTLAHYDPHPVERLGFEATVKKLVEAGHFPRRLLSHRYRPGAMIRGLVVDRRRGNILKMDYYNYVTRAHHGESPLSPEERKRVYSHRRVRLSAESYASVDTLFHLPEAYLYQLLVDRLDREGPAGSQKYSRLYSLVRRTIDQAHADGSIKQVLTGDKNRYLRPDPRLISALLRLRQSGKKLFLLTNSELYYTDELLSYLLGDGTDGRTRWQDYFDLIWVEARKPSFFLMGNRSHLKARRLSRSGETPPIFAGGNGAFFERQLGFSGDQVLYFGDHTYGDILRSKKSLGWRTAMIVPELRREIAITESLQNEFEALGEMAREQDQREGELALLERQEGRLNRARGNPGGSRPAAGSGRGGRFSILRREKERLGEEIGRLSREIKELELRYDAAYHPRWGPLFREGRETSRFGHQVKDFACIYMARVSSLLNYPANHYFQSPVDLMPHEL